MKRTMEVGTLFVMAMFLAGCGSSGNFQSNNGEALMPVQKPDITTDAVDVTPHQPLEGGFIRNLCNKGVGTDYTGFEVIVEKCGDYYSLSQTDVLDAGRTIVDADGGKIDVCGGMPEEAPMPAPSVCGIPCGSENLCMGIEVDCSTIAIYETNRCYLQNRIRMNDKTYCDRIADQYTKDQCLNYELGK